MRRLSVLLLVIVMVTACNRFKSTEQKKEEAIGYYNKGTDILGETYAKESSERMGEAIHYFEKAANLDPDHAETYCNWGCALQTLAELKKSKSIYKEAIEKFEKDSQLRPNLGSVFYNWGDALSGLAQLEKEEAIYWQAADKFRQAALLDPKDVDAYCSWGNTLYDLALLKKDEDIYQVAIDKYKMALDIDPDDKDSNFNCALAMLDMAKMTNKLPQHQSEIIELFTNAYQLDERSAPYNLACVYSLVGDADQAFYWFNIDRLRNNITKYELENEPDFDNIRSDKRYAELIKKLP